jgi:lactoylglutathione lyase
MMEAPGLLLGLHPGGDENASSGTVSVGFEIDDHEAAKALLEKLAIPYKPEDDGKSGLYCHFKDPDGTVLFFVKPQWD